MIEIGKIIINKSDIESNYFVKKATLNGVEYSATNMEKFHRWTWKSTASGIILALADEKGKVIKIRKADVFEACKKIKFKP